MNFVLMVQMWHEQHPNIRLMMYCHEYCVFFSHQGFILFFFYFYFSLLRILEFQFNFMNINRREYFCKCFTIIAATAAAAGYIAWNKASEFSIEISVWKFNSSFSKVKKTKQKRNLYAFAVVQGPPNPSFFGKCFKNNSWIFSQISFLFESTLLSVNNGK